MSKTKQYWLIRGYDSATLIYERKVGAGQMTESQVQALLMALVAKAGLDFDEIVSAYAKKKTKIHTNHLLVHRDGPYPRFCCGTNPHFSAMIVPFPYKELRERLKREKRDGHMLEQGRNRKTP